MLQMCDGHSDTQSPNTLPSLSHITQNRQRHKYQKKERHRGFNQAELIAKEIGKITGRKVFPLLQRNKDETVTLLKDIKEKNVILVLLIILQLYISLFLTVL